MTEISKAKTVKVYFLQSPFKTLQVPTSIQYQQCKPGYYSKA